MNLDRRSIVRAATLLAAALGFGGRSARAAEGTFPVAMSDAEWQGRLDPRAYDVLRRPVEFRNSLKPTRSRAGPWT